MANEMFTQLPSVANAELTDIICAVQGYVSPSSPGTSVQETFQQVFTLMQSNVVLSFAGNPNGSVAGITFQFCWDTTNTALYICTTSGTTSTAVWTLVSSLITSPTKGGTGVSNPTAHTLPVAEGSSNFTFLGPLTNGQLLIGSTGADPVPAALTAGTNITVTNGGGTITIAATGAGGFSWTDVSGTTATMVSGNGYIANNAGLVTLTLPATSVEGDEISIIGKGAGGWSIAQAAGQLVRIGSSVSTVGVGGSISSTNRYDSVDLVCTVANTTWTTRGGPQGILTIV